MKKIKELGVKIIDKSSIMSLVSNNNYLIEKIFFKIFSSNENLVKIYNKKITNDREVDNLYYSFKQFSNLILNSDNEKDFENKIPKYLFREKSFFIKIFRKYNNAKKKLLLKLLYDTEKLLRLNGGLSIALGLRFLLRFKKITIS